MLIGSKRTRRFLVVAAIAAVLALATSAFMASNTVQTTKLGEGAGAISGYTVSGVDYTMNGSNPQNIDSVSFTLDAEPAAGSTVKVRLVSSGSTWYTCTLSGTPAVSASCTTTGATVSTANELTVVVA